MRIFRTLMVGVLAVGLSGFALAEDTELAKKMDEVSGSLKQLRRVKDDYAAGVELIHKAQKAMIECFPMTPELLEAMPEGKEKKEAMAKYGQVLAESLATLYQLELAYIAEDQDLIDDATDAWKKSRKAGHKEFIDEES